MKIQKIGIVGYGYVGLAVTKLLRDHFDLRVYDVVNSPNTKSEINECDMAIVCVPTPMKEDKSCDISIVEDTIKWLKTPIIMIKSTVPPGTTRELTEKYGKKIVFSPEYIGEGKYFIPYWRYPHPTDMKYHEFIIVGGSPADTAEAIEPFKAVMGPNAKYVQTSSTLAEMTKYMCNSWGAHKVTFANEWFEIANIFGVNYDELRELFVLDTRVEKIHTAVLKSKRGFGGKCFPKDVNAIVKATEKAGYSPELLKQVLKSNDEFIKKNIS
jgi:nucleotide sugar dehydrogenase